MTKLLIISFDAVGDSLFNTLMNGKNFARLAERSSVMRNVSSIDLSNTYPIHTSVITGTEPVEHGLISNKEPIPCRNAKWYYKAENIKKKTLWQAAHEAGLKVGSVLWPVTGGAKEIKWNIPEILVQADQNAAAEYLRYGSKLLELEYIARFRQLLNGIRQPQLDHFASTCMEHMLRKKKPDLALVHLTAYDGLCHKYGPGNPKLERAFESLEESLERLLGAITEDTNVLLFSDHSQFPVNNSILPNDLLVEMGHMKKDDSGNYQYDECYFECCGGSAFLHPGKLGTEEIAGVKRKIANIIGFNRFLTDREMERGGRKELPFGFCVHPGWNCEIFKGHKRGEHGYPVDYDDYSVFYMVSGPAFTEGIVEHGGSVLDIAPLAATVLGVTMPGLRQVDQVLLRR